METTVDPVRDIEIINLELILADLQTVENRIAKVERKAKTKDKEAMAELALLRRLQPHLEAEQPARTLEMDEDELTLVKGYGLITMKPVIYIANTDEEGVSDPDGCGYWQQVKSMLKTMAAKRCCSVPKWKKIFRAWTGKRNRSFWMNWDCLPPAWIRSSPKPMPCSGCRPS